VGVGPEINSLQRGRRGLRVSFATLEAFRSEYRENLVRGGLFVPTAESLELREEVEVELELTFRDASYRLTGEVVSVVPEGLAQSGVAQGIALQLNTPSDELRKNFEPLVGQVPEPDPGRQVGERRVAARRRARAMGRLSGADANVAVRTRDLSRTGVLVSVEGASSPAVGENVQLVIAHPVTNDTLEVEGCVVRHIEGEGSVPALAVAFTEEVAAQPEVERFVDDLQSFGHARNLASIQGPIAELGLASLLQSFSNGAPRGTLTVCRGSEEGRITFEGGRLLAARLGAATGAKALARLMQWEDGQFEFHAHLDDEEHDDPVLPLEVALLDAARQVDELRRLDPPPVEPCDLLEVVVATLEVDAGEVCKTEAAVFDLATAGFTVRAMMDVIPDEDHLILNAIGALLDRGILARSG
jgi:Tfp pilus assembly protein PilZ